MMFLQNYYSKTVYISYCFCFWHFMTVNVGRCHHSETYSPFTIDHSPLVILTLLILGSNDNRLRRSLTCTHANTIGRMNKAAK